MALATVLLSVFLPFAVAANSQGIDDAGISRLITSGQIDAAQRALEAQNPTEVDRLFFAGRILKAQGRFPEAIQLFREVMRRDPDHLNARRELAHTLMLNRDYGPAEYHFDALLRIDGNEAMRAGYRSFLKAIEENKPFGISGFVSVLPSTNINRGTTNTTLDTSLGEFVIDPNSRAESGIGLSFGLSGYLRRVASPVSRVMLQWSLSGARYEEDRFDYSVGTIGVSYDRLTRWGRWFVNPFFRNVWREDDADHQAAGLRFGVTRRLSDRNQLGFFGSHEYRDYSNLGYQDGSYNTASLRFDRQLSPSVTVGGGVGYEAANPEAEHLQYNAHPVFANLAKSWEGGLQTTFGVWYGRRDFVGDYPLTTEPRVDRAYRLSVGVQHSGIDMRGFTPHLYCSHAINHSNVAFYDFVASECQFSLTRNF